MFKEEDINLGNKRKEYNSKILNIESILIKIENVLNVSKFINQLDEIKERNNYNTTTDDYDRGIQELDVLNKMIIDVALPFYEIHLLTTKIDSRLKNIINENIDEIIMNTKELIDILIAVSGYENRDVSYLFDKSYRIIYQIIIHEEIFE